MIAAGAAPPADVRLVPAALTAWGVTAAGTAWECGGQIAAVCAALAVVGLAAIVRGRDASPAVRAAGFGMVGAAVIGAGFGGAIALRVDAIRHHPVTHRFGTAALVTATPTESPHSVGSGRMMFRAALVNLDGVETSGRVMVFASMAGFGELSAGQPARFRARITRPTRRDLTVAVLTTIGEPSIGSAGTFQRAAHAVRDRFATIARDVLPADQAAMLPGLVLGDTSAVNPATTAQFRTAGLTHLTAVSGANVTIVCGAVMLSASLVGPRVAVGIAGVTLVAFVIVVQPSASVLRAAAMGAIALFAVLTTRRRQAIPALSACLLVLMIGAPQLAVDIGFALSVVATAALIGLAPVWSARLVGRGCPKPLADAICVSAAAQLVTAPLVAAISGQFSVIAVLANLIAAVVITPITVAGTAAAALCLLWPVGAGLLIRLTGPELWVVLRVARVAAGIPGAGIPVPSGVVGLLLIGGITVAGILLWRWRWFRLAAACAVLGWFAWSVSAVSGSSVSHGTIVG